MSNLAPPFQVFLSYGRPDAQIVHSFYRTLLSSGVTPWMDVESIAGGEDWQTAIKNAIKRSQLVLIFLSKSVISREGYLQDEILEALEVSRKKPPGQVFLIPVRLDDCPIHPRLAPFQCVNLLAENAGMRLLQQIQGYRRAYLESRLSELSIAHRAGAIPF